jgi:ubiquitin carboxyl-terminal hydrolase 10
MSLANAVLRLLIYCPPFRGLFRDLGQLVGQREGGETGGGTTPLVDATVKFFEEFMFLEEPPSTQQLQLAAGGKPREDEEAKKEHDAVDPFEPMYMYDAMKEKRQLRNLLVCFRAT